MSEQPLVTVGVVADTHVPDRAVSLPPGMVEGLRAARVERILHAGDICTQRVLTELSAIAPVSAVAGNRDFTIIPSLPMKYEEKIGGVTVGMIHGHGGMSGYWKDKLSYLFEGYQLARYQRTVLASCPNARVLIWGHTHHPENIWMKGRLFFNPGTSVGFRLGPYDFPPSYGVLRFYPEGRVEGEIVALNCVLQRGGAWKIIPSP
jgi:putative phosphoesterase